MTRRTRSIYHITLASELRAGSRGAFYTPLRFEADGFVHCAVARNSILAIARDYFSAATEPVLVLRIDPSRLSARLVFEAAAPIAGGGTTHLRQGRLFPHVYGPIDLAAITGCAALRGGRGQFSWPARFRSLAGWLAEPQR